MFVHSGMIQDPMVWLLKLLWEVRPFEHIDATEYMKKSCHRRLQEVWSKLQILSFLDNQYDVVCVLDTDTMAVQTLDEVFQKEAPAAVFRGTTTGYLGKKRPTANIRHQRSGQQADRRHQWRSRDVQSM